jgi:hypothetical protein
VADLLMEADFGCVCFIRCILMGCRGVFLNMEAGVGGSIT